MTGKCNISDDFVQYVMRTPPDSICTGICCHSFQEQSVIRCRSFQCRQRPISFLHVSEILSGQYSPKLFGLWNDAIKSLCSSVRRFRDLTIKEECKRDYPQALQALWKALDRAADLIQS